LNERDSLGTQDYLPVTFSGNELWECSLGVVACNVSLQGQQNRFIDMKLGAWQLRDVNVNLDNNHVEGCSGTAFSLKAMVPLTEGTCARLCGNTYIGCNVGIRLTSANTAKCSLQAAQEKLENNGDGAIILSPNCRAKFVACNIRGSRRCGARIGRGAHGSFEGCLMSWNGRAVAVAASSAAEIVNCNFDNNVGWAIRLEDAPSSSSNAGASSGSVVSGNVFGHAQHGNVGRKRVRIDGWEEGRAHFDGNIEDAGAAVEPVLKRRRNIDEEADEAAELFAGMSLEAAGYV
jgi:hypothetical protein